MSSSAPKKPPRRTVSTSPAKTTSQIKPGPSSSRGARGRGAASTPPQQQARKQNRKNVQEKRVSAPPAHSNPGKDESNETTSVRTMYLFWLILTMNFSNKLRVRMSVLYWLGWYVDF